MAGGLVTDLVTSFSLVPLTSRKDVTRLNTAIQHVEPPPTTLGRKINPHGPPVVPDPVRLGLGRYRRSAPYDTFTIDALTTKMVSRQVSHVVRRPTKRTPNPTCFQIPTCPPGDARDNATILCPPTFHPSHPMSSAVGGPYAHVLRSLLLGGVQNMRIVPVYVNTCTYTFVQRLGIFKFFIYDLPVVQVNIPVGEEGADINDW